MAQSKNKTGRITDYLVIAFVLAASVLVLAEIGGNVSNELETWQANAVEITHPTPTPLPTLSPEEYDKLMNDTRN
jgi:hypothetical protein